MPTSRSGRDQAGVLIALQPRLRIDIGWRDLASVLPPMRQNRAALEAAIAAHAPEGVHAVVGLSVRTLFDALLAEARPQTVAMTAVNISGMSDLIRLHGARIRTIDIDPASLAPSTSALRDAAHGAAMIVAAHLYGRRLPSDLLTDLGPAVVVEDCAQAFDGALRLSPGADVALYSFGPIKTATALGGGVALFRDAAHADRVRAHLTALPPRTEGWFLNRAIKYAALKCASIPALYGLIVGAIALADRDPDAIIGGVARGFSGDVPTAIRHTPPRRMLRLMARRLSRWAEPAPAVEDAIQALSDLCSVPGRQAQGRCWLLPVMHPRPVELVRALRDRGLDATRGATSLRASGDAPQASRLMEEVVYLPLPADPAAAHRLSATFAAALKDLS